MGKSTTTTEKKMPEWQEKYIRDNILPRAEEIADTPFTEYTGDRVAGFTDLMNKAKGTLDASDFGNASINEAKGVFSDLAAMTPEDYAAMTRKNYNPYQTDVIDASLDVASRGRAKNQIADMARISKAGAFGGDRRDVYQAESDAVYDLGTNQMVANLMRQGYSEAQANTMAQLQAKSGAAGNLVGATNDEIKNMLAGVGSQMTTGGLEMGLNQAGLDAQYAEFMRKEQDPLMKLQALLAGASGVPGGLGTTTGTTRKGIGDTLGGIMGAAGSLGTGFGFGSGVNGGRTFASLFGRD
jgi:hypothetical protein